MEKKIVKYLQKHFKGDVSNKTILITGGNSGIGFASARIALYLKMKVIIACRNQNRGEAAINKLKEEFPNGSVSLMIVDMSEEESIRRFAQEIIDKKLDIDVFYHNAGVYRLPYQIKEGRELVASTNYFGPYLLTSLILKYLHSLKHKVKMIFTSSLAAKWATYKLDMLEPTEKVSRMRKYSNSKMLDAHLFKYLLDNDHNNIDYYLVHPGTTATNLFFAAYKSKVFIFFGLGFIKLIGNPLWKSSLSLVRVLSEDGVPGSFYGPTHLYNMRGYPKENHFIDKRFKNNQEIINRTKEIMKTPLL